MNIRMINISNNLDYIIDNRENNPVPSKGDYIIDIHGKIRKVHKVIFDYMNSEVRVVVD